MKNCELKCEIVGLIHDSLELVGGIEVMHDQFDELVKKSLNFDVGRGNVCFRKEEIL